jgi:small subunit ribosomal protein S16
VPGVLVPAGHHHRGDAIAHQEVYTTTLAVRIRLTRVGATKQPSYRFVVADSRSARDGRSIDTLGHYNPRTEPVEINVDAEKAAKWMAQGAKPSATVERLFRQVGILPDIS